jgi:hypothetical protein
MQVTFAVSVKGVSRFPHLALAGSISVLEGSAEFSDYSINGSGPTSITLVAVDDEITLDGGH